MREGGGDVEGLVVNSSLLLKILSIFCTENNQTCPGLF